MVARRWIDWFYAEKFRLTENNQRFRSLLGLLLLCLATSDAVQAQAESVGGLRIGVQQSLRPFSYLDARGKRVGFEVELAEALCEVIQRRCKMTAMPFQEIIPALQSRSIDAALASMSITDARKSQVDFSVRYYKSPARFVALRTKELSVTPDALAGKVIGLKRGTTFESYARDVLGARSKIIRYAQTEDALVDLVLGRVDTVLADGIYLRESFLNSAAGRGYQLVGDPIDDPRWFGDGIGIPVAKGDAALVQAFDNAIAQLRRNGIYTQIRRRYFDDDIYGQ